MLLLQDYVFVLAITFVCGWLNGNISMYISPRYCMI